MVAHLPTGSELWFYYLGIGAPAVLVLVAATSGGDLVWSCFGSSLS